MQNSIPTSWLYIITVCIRVSKSSSFFPNSLMSSMYIMISFERFSHLHSLMVSLWSLSDNKSPQVSRTLLSILPNLNNVVVWMVFTRLVIYKSSSPCTNPLVTIPRATITFNIIVNFMFHSFVNSQARSRYFSNFFNFTRWSAGTAKSTILQVLPLFFCFFVFVFVFLFLFLFLCFDYFKIWSSGRDLVIRLCLRIPEKSLCVSFSKTDFELCIYHFSYGQTSTSCLIPCGSPCPLILFLCLFAAFAYDVIDRFVSFTT